VALENHVRWHIICLVHGERSNVHGKRGDLEADRGSMVNRLISLPPTALFCMILPSRRGPDLVGFPKGLKIVILRGIEPGIIGPPRRVNVHVHSLSTFLQAFPQSRCCHLYIFSNSHPHIALETADLQGTTRRTEARCDCGCGWRLSTDHVSQSNLIASCHGSSALGCSVCRCW
jgi:hypothetical protein